MISCTGEFILKDNPKRPSLSTRCGGPLVKHEALTPVLQLYLGHHTSISLLSLAGTSAKGPCIDTTGARGTSSIAALLNLPSISILVETEARGLLAARSNYISPPYTFSKPFDISIFTRESWVLPLQFPTRAG